MQVSLLEYRFLSLLPASWAWHLQPAGHLFEATTNSDPPVALEAF